ncbi:ABC transporter permease [Iodidimonas sp. SYSU 1G8]|uniref:ABC transporter permease n=1 Tax=Iodidimonas sp. SYSU 1G8 TaxID=3133967 RepID=UPI0031FF09D0
MSALHASGKRRWSGRLTSAEGWVIPLLVLAVWDLSARLAWVDPRLWAPPAEVISTAFVQISDGTVFVHVLASLQRQILGFVLGSSIGLALGVVLASSRLADQLFGPLLHAIKQVAIFTWIPLLSIWVGSGELAKVTFIALACVFPVMLGAYEGVRGIDPRFREVADALQLTRAQKIRRLIIPSALPAILGGLQLALIFAWLAVIGADYFFIAAPGLGTSMLEGRDHFQMDVVIFDMLVIGLIGFGYIQLARRAEGRLLRWQGSARAKPKGLIRP